MGRMPSSWSTRPNWVGNGPPRQLFLDAPQLASAALKDAMPIDVQRDRYALIAGHRPQPLHVTLRVLVLAEQRPRHHAGGIVDAADQAERRAVGTEPAVWTAVGLHQQAGLRHALASSAVVGWAACSGAAHTLAEQQLAHGGSPQE